MTILNTSRGKSMIHVKLTGAFVKLAPAGNDNGAFDLECKPGLTIPVFLEQLGILGLGLKYTVLINNARKPQDYVLCDGDSVLIMPLLAGG